MRLWIAFLVLVFCGMRVAQGQASSPTTELGPTSTYVPTNIDTKPTDGSSTYPNIGSSSTSGKQTKVSQETTTPAAPVTKPSDGSTINGGTTENPGSRPSTTPIELTTQPFVVTTATWPIRLEDTDPTILLQAIAKLNYSVAILKSNLTDLYSNLSGNNSYVAQLEALNKTILQLQENTTNLSDDIDNAIAIYNATYEYAQPLLDTITCFKDSLCAAPRTTTPWIPSPSMCPASVLPANKTVQKFTYSSTLEYNCATTLRSSDDNPIVYTLNLTLTGNASLQVFDPSQTVLRNYTTNQSNVTEEFNLLELTFQYKEVKSGDQISLSVDYNTKDLCAEVACNDGNCVVVDGKPICNCLACHSGEFCTELKNPCNGTQVNRKCWNNGGNCTRIESDTCTWKCNCPNGSQDPNDPQACLKPTGASILLEEARKWLYWEN